MNEQTRRLRRLLLIRVIIISFILIVTLVFHVRGSRIIPPENINQLYWLLGIVYVLTILSLLFLSRVKNLQVFSTFLIVVEVTFTAGLVYYTGLSESIFIILFPINILSAGIILMSGRMSFFATSLSSLYLIVIVLTQGYSISFDKDLSILVRSHFSSSLLYRILMYITAFYLISLLLTYLTQQFQRVRKALEEKEQDLSEMENFSRSIVSSLASGLITLDNSGKITSFNEAAERITGYKFPEVIYRPLEEVLPQFKFPIHAGSGPEDDEGIYGRFESSYSNREGQDVYFGYTLSPLKDSYSERVGLIINFQDITRFKEMEERIEIEDRLAKLARENIILKKELKAKYNLDNIIGISPEINEVFEMIRQVADTKSNVLVSGESGTGKELVARAVHYNSSRRDKAFVAVNCSAIPEQLMESELFGHRKGSFTGAVQHKVGLFKAADTGSLFLDEIGDLSPTLQVKLLRVIQERSFREVGGINDIAVDVRIIAATNRELEKEVEKGVFRKDLFYRLNVIQIHIPPLRNRTDDIPILAQHFLEKFTRELGKEHVKKISSEAMQILLKYGYPGNVRELENIIERGVAMEKTDILLPESLPAELQQKRQHVKADDKKCWLEGINFEIPEQGLNLEDLINEIERNFLERALVKTDGVKKDAAKLLNISFRSFRYRLEKFKMD